MKLTQKFALAVGVIYLSMGIMGFIPALVAQADTLPYYVENLGVVSGFGYLMGLFPVNTPHNIVRDRSRQLPPVCRTAGYLLQRPSIIRTCARFQHLFWPLPSVWARRGATRYYGHLGHLLRLLCHPLSAKAL